jgi:hypothetical protein
MFQKVAHQVLDLKWTNAAKILFDTCFIQFDNDTKLFIVSPVESDLINKINKILPNEKNNEDNESWFSHYKKDKHPLKIIRKIDDNDLLGHALVYMALFEKWRFFGRFVYMFEFLIYLSFLAAYTLNSLSLFKDNSMPSWLKWISLGLIIVIISYETVEIICLKFYYFISFSHYFEWINMILCLLALFLEEPNVKTSLYAFSLTYAYLTLIFRSEKSTVFGTYSYAFRKILIKSLRVFPLVMVLFFAFFFAFKIRSRYITNLDQDHDEKEISAIDSYMSYGLIKLGLMFMGNIDVSEMGLGHQGTVNSVLINIILVDAFIFLMPIFLFNLFIGIAVGELSDIVNKGQYHLLKVRIDFLLRLFYLYSFLRLSRLAFFRNRFHRKYIWQTKKTLIQAIYLNIF